MIYPPPKLTAGVRGKNDKPQHSINVSLGSKKGGVMALFGILAVILFVLLIAALVIFTIAFWICMIIDCVKREFRQPNEKIVWILVLIFLHFLGALIYWGVVKKSSSVSK